MRDSVLLLSLGHPLTLFSSVNGECVAHELVADPTEEEGVYTVECKYTPKQSSLNSAFNHKVCLTKSLILHSICQ